jgi:hypothetical protein
MSLTAHFGHGRQEVRGHPVIFANSISEQGPLDRLAAVVLPMHMCRHFGREPDYKHSLA